MPGGAVSSCRGALRGPDGSAADREDDQGEQQQDATGGDRQTADLVQSKATYWDFYLRRALFEHAEGHDAEAAAAMATARALVCRPRLPVDGRPPTVDGGIAMRLIRAELVLSGRTPDDKSLWR